MDSGLFTRVLSSPEVIVASLALILLLPLVFFIASTKSRRRLVRVVPRAGARTRSAAAAGRAAGGEGRSEPARAERDGRLGVDDRGGGRSEDDRPGPRRGGRAGVLDEDEEPEDRA